MLYRKQILIPLLVCSAASLSRCHNFNKFWLAPPANLRYASSPFVFTLGTSIGVIKPSVTGDVESCKSDVALPAGLTIDAVNCALSGVPTANQLPASYKITAANEVGSTSTTISIEVNSNPPSAPVYAGSPYVFIQGNAITPLTPVITGTVTSCSGALPPGLSLDSACVISGIPTTVSAATGYSITATNAFGSGPAGNINITVNPETTPPSTPASPGATAISQTQIDLNWAASTDNITAQASLIYEICQSTSAGTCGTTFTATYTTGAGVVNYSATGLTAGTTYYFMIRAKDAANNVSAGSTEVSAMTNVAGTVNNPVPSPAPGLYNSAQSVSLSVASPAAATICYTTNGSTPSCDAPKTGCTGGTLYSAAIGLGTTDTTVKAIGCKATYADSAVSTSVYTFDTTAPTVTNVTASAANGTYTVSNIITIQVTFSEIVNVTGTPTLSLATGSPASTAINYTSGSGTTTLNFDYTIASGNTSPDLDYVNTTSLTAGTAIRDTALNNAVLTLPTPGGAGSLGGNKALIVNPPPTITSSTPTAAANVPSQTKVVVTFDKAMNQPSAQGAFSLTPGPVAGSFSWAGNVMTFTPSAAIPSSGSYTYTITTAALSSEGVPLASAYNRTFNVYRGKMYTMQTTNPAKRFADGEGMATPTSLNPSGSFGLYVVVDTQRDILYVSDGTANAVRIWTNASTTVAGAPNAVLTITAPSGVVIDKATDRLYVSSYPAAPNRKIFVFNNASTLITGTPTPDRTVTHANFQTSSTGLRGMDIDFSRDILYVTDYNGTSGSLFSYDSASTINGTVAPTRTLTITGQGPSGVSVDQVNDRLYIATFSTANIHIFDGASTLNGSVAGGTRVLSGAATTLNTPNSLHYVPELDRLYVANYGANTVNYWNSASTVNGNIAPNATLPAMNTVGDVFFDPLR